MEPQKREAENLIHRVGEEKNNTIMKRLLKTGVACSVMAACLMSLCMMSACGGGNSKKVAVREIDIYGDLNYYEDEDDWFGSGSDEIDDYLSVEDGFYKFSVVDDKLVVEVPVKTIKSFPNMHVDEIDESFLSVLDADNKYIKNEKGEDVDLKLENPEVITTIMSSAVGDKNTLKFSYALLGETGILEQIEDFDISIDLNLTKSGPSQGGSDDWDEILDDYEKYADEYIACAKKAAEGDLSAMSDLVSLMETAQELGEKLEQASGDLSSDQVARYSRITAKFASAMLDM